MSSKVSQIRILTASVLSAALLAGCQTYDPAKVCTADWIKPRADAAVKQVRSSAGSVLSRLEKTASEVAKGNSPSPFTLFALASSIKSLEKKLTRGKGMKTLRVLAQTCNDPDLITNSLRSVMIEQGLSTNFINFIEQQPQYQRLIQEQLAAPAPKNAMPK